MTPTQKQVDPANILAEPSRTGMSDLQERYLRLQVEALEKDVAKTKEDEQQRVQIRKAGAQAMAQRAAEQEAIQSSCPHLKPNSMPSIGGQRDHQGHYNWICLYCGKEWKDNGLPPQLRIDMSMVGGPQV